MKCPRCGTETYENVCPGCGYDLSNIKQEVTNNVEINNNVEVNNTIKTSKKKLNLGLIVGVVIVVIGIVCGGYFVINNSTTSSSNEVSNSLEEEVSGSFFLSNGNLCALFNSDGKQLTDFIYNKNSENYKFHNGVVLVRTKDDEAKLIDENGKIIIDGNRTNNMLDDLGYFYRIQDGTKATIVNYKNKVIKEIPYGTKYTPIYNNDYLLIHYDDSYVLYNKEGKELKKEARTTSKDTSYQFNLYNKYGYLLAFIEGKNYLYDKNEKLVAEFDSTVRYCLDKLDNNDYLISHCLDKYSERNKERKVFSNGKIYDIPDEWYRIEFSGTQPMAVVNSKTYFLTSDYKLGREYKGKSYEEFFDENTYTVSGTREMQFYKNGELVNKVPNLGVNLGYFGTSQVSDFYTLYDRDNKVYYAYDKSGKQLFGTGYSVIDKTGDGLYRVKDSDSKYYVIDTKGKKITKGYDNIYEDETAKNKYYTVTIGDTKQVLDKNEKKLYECNKCEITIKTFLGRDYAEIRENSTLRAIADLKNKKEILRTTGEIITYDQYMKVEADNTTKYYTYTGKLIYTK